MNSAKSSATTMLAVLTMRWIVSGKRASGTTRKTRPFYKNTFAHHTNMSEKRKIVLDTNCLIAYDVLQDIDFPKLLVLKLKEFLDLLQSEDNHNV